MQVLKNMIKAAQFAVLLALPAATLAAPNGPIAIKGAQSGSGSRAATSPGPLTRDELRACMHSETELTQREQALEHDRVDHKKMLAAYAQASAPAINGSSTPTQANDITVEKINESADLLNARTEKMHADNATYQAQCASRRYLLKDKTALIKEQKEASRGTVAVPPAPAPAPASTTVSR